jgi:molecular chaperone HtpG
LRLVDPINKYAITQLKVFDGKKLICVLKEDLGLEETEEMKQRKDEVTQFNNIRRHHQRSSRPQSRESYHLHRLAERSRQFGWSSNMPKPCATRRCRLT